MIEKTVKIHILEPDKFGIQGRFGNAHDIAVIKALDAFSVDRAERFVDFVGGKFHFDNRTVGKDDSTRIDAHIRADGTAQMHSSLGSMIGPPADMQ